MTWFTAWLVFCAVILVLIQASGDGVPWSEQLSARWRLFVSQQRRKGIRLVYRTPRQQAIAKAVVGSRSSLRAWRPNDAA